MARRYLKRSEPEPPTRLLDDPALAASLAARDSGRSIVGTRLAADQGSIEVAGQRRPENRKILDNLRSLL
jgi:hypothetical protein